MADALQPSGSHGSNLDFLKESGSSAQNGLRYQPDYSGNISTLQSGTAGQVTVLAQPAATTTIADLFPLTNASNLQYALASGSGTAVVLIAGWDKWGNYQYETVTTVDGTAASPDKDYKFLPSMRQAVLISNTDVATTEDVELQDLTNSSAIIGAIDIVGTNDITPQPYIVIPPNGVARINYLALTCSAAVASTWLLREIDMYANVDRVLFTILTNNNTVTKFDVTTGKGYLQIEGGLYGKTIYFTVLGNSANHTVNMTYDLWALGMPGGLSSAIAAVTGPANIAQVIS